MNVVNTTLQDAVYQSCNCHHYTGTAIWCIQHQEKILCMRSYASKKVVNTRNSYRTWHHYEICLSLLHMVINWFSFFFILSCGFTCVMIHILDDMTEILFRIDLDLIFVDLGSKFLKENKAPWTLPSIHEITSQV